MTISALVYELRPDSLGGIWARVIIDVELAEKSNNSDSIDISIYLPGAASLTFLEAQERAKQAAHALLKKVATKG